MMLADFLILIYGLVVDLDLCKSFYVCELSSNRKRHPGGSGFYRYPYTPGGYP